MTFQDRKFVHNSTSAVSGSVSSEREEEAKANCLEINSQGKSERMEKCLLSAARENICIDKRARN